MVVSFKVGTIVCLLAMILVGSKDKNRFQLWPSVDSVDGAVSARNAFSDDYIKLCGVKLEAGIVEAGRVFDQHGLPAVGSAVYRELYDDLDGMSYFSPPVVEEDCRRWRNTAPRSIMTLCCCNVCSLRTFLEILWYKRNQTRWTPFDSASLR